MQFAWIFCPFRAMIIFLSTNQSSIAIHLLIVDRWYRNTANAWIQAWSYTIFTAHEFELSIIFIFGWWKYGCGSTIGKMNRSKRHFIALIIVFILKFTPVGVTHDYEHYDKRQQAAICGRLKWRKKNTLNWLDVVDKRSYKT